MQEFSSISVSSYEAGVLADRLTEQSALGWDVVAIVPTGSTVTAYFSRPAGDRAVTDSAVAEAVVVEHESSEPDTSEPEPDADASEAAIETDADEADTDAGEDTSADEVADTDEADSGEADSGEADSGEADSGESEAEADAETMIDEIMPEAATADEDDGWAALVSEVSEEAAADISSSLSDRVDVDSTSEPAAATSVADIAPEPAGEAAPATETATAAAAGAAPAGWYADPSSRFELRYWDGAQWTEHVSRAGQQYTDPPVA